MDELMSPLRVSASALRSFTSCAYRYCRDYVARLPREERAPVPSFALGEAVHRALATFTKRGGHARQTKDDLLNLLVDCWDGQSYPDSDAEVMAFHRAKAMLATYYEQPYPEEIAQDLAIEEFINWRQPRNGILATGKLDRACLLENGTVLVIDYKTSIRPSSVEYVRGDWQAIMYRSLARSLLERRFRHLEGARIVIAFHYLATATPVTVEYEHDDFMKRWRAITSIAREIQTTIQLARDGLPLREAFPLQRGAQCQTCPMRRHCDSIAPSTFPDTTHLPAQGDVL